MTEAVTVVCCRTTDQRQPSVCGTTTCDECRHDVWISPAAVKALSGSLLTSRRVLCIECLVRLKPKGVEWATTEEQNAECLKHMGITAEEFYATFGIRPGKL